MQISVTCLYNIYKIEIENLDNNLMKFSVCINQTTGKERKNNKKHEWQWINLQCKLQIS